MTTGRNPWDTAPAAVLPNPDADHPAAMGDASASGMAEIRVGLRRAADVRDTDVIGLPDEVFIAEHPVGGTGWRWHPVRSARLPNAHRWRLVMACEDPDDEHLALLASVPVGFRALRVSDDRPDQGCEYLWRVIAVREYDLVQVQIPITLPAAPPDAGRG